ncbi:MAG: glycosyltransferase [Cyclobacteriaceae bacterium]
MFGYSILEILVCLIAGVALLEDVLLILMFRPFTYHPAKEPLPRISVLLAMRDEEDNVDRCLYAVRALDYPPDRMEILVGDDSSSDNTWKKLQRHAQEDNRIHLYKITGQAGVARGKANVLAQLIDHTTSDYFLITDADVAVSSSWARAMTADVPAGVGLVNGLTAVDGNIFQHLEWIHAQGMMHVLQQFTPVTAIGNNMMVTRKAYKSTGGFETISFSVTEDFALTREVIKKGFRLQSRLSYETHGTTLAEGSFAALLSQRKRWMQGAVRLQPGIVSLLLVRAFYYPAILIMFFFFPVAGALVFLVKSLLQAGLIVKADRQTSRRTPFYGYLLFELYECAMIWLEILIYLVPGKVRWKGRDF